jgi:hypothetical protein
MNEEVAVKESYSWNSSLMNRVQFWAVLLMALGAYYLFFRAPAANEKQLAFRIAIFATGTVGFVTIQIIRFSRNRTSGPDRE